MSNEHMSKVKKKKKTNHLPLHAQSYTPSGDGSDATSVMGAPAPLPVERRMYCFPLPIMPKWAAVDTASSDASYGDHSHA
jgi:hypothetical protein